MTDHLPECPYVVFDQQGQIPATVIPGRCICRALRACEQRVREGEVISLKAAYRAGRKRGHAEGVQAASDAVKAEMDAAINVCGECTDVALAAIDALREETK